MKFILFLSLLLCANLSLSDLFCPRTSEPPQDIQIDPSYTLSPITYSGVTYKTIQIANKIFLNKNKEGIYSATSALYDDSDFCPDDFVIPKREDYEAIITQLGTNALSTFTDSDGFNLEAGKYYLTNTKGASMNKTFMYLEGNDIKFIDAHPFKVKSVCRCMLDLSRINLVFPEIGDAIELNQTEEILIQTSKEKYASGFLWKIEGETYTTKTIKHKFTRSGMHMVEFWAKYINGEILYLCENVFVKREPIHNAQNSTFVDTDIKIIETDFQMEYTPTLHFEHSNSPVDPRIDGGYYISITTKDQYLHVLSYDKEDKLIRDFNTNQKAYPFDITSTEYGFAVYMKEVGSSYHSYLSVYNKDFELINTVQIMNNNANDDKTKVSEKQIIKYDSSGTPVFGMNFMYEPDNGKLIYSRGRIFLIFCHYNHFLDKGGHTGDTVVTFNDNLSDMDFGVTWGSSHSLIQSATFDDFYFWTAALGDAYPQGINVEYTSKTKFTNEYDPINKKYNSRISAEISSIAGSIKGYQNGSADGKLGGILYFAKLGLYCLVYAKTPDPQSGKNIIYMTTWEFIDNKISNIQTTEVKRFGSNNVMQVRAGRYGNNKVFIIYSETTSSGGNSYGNVQKGTTPKLYIIKLPSKKFIVKDMTYDNLLMNTNEDLRTFENGVLIWATANKEGKLTINKIGTNDNEDILDEADIDEEVEEEEKEEGNLSGGAIAGIVVGSVGGAAGIGVGVYFLLKYLKNKKSVPEPSTQTKVDINFSSSKSDVNNNTTKRGKRKKKTKN